MIANFDYPNNSKDTKVSETKTIVEDPMRRTWGWHESATAILAVTLIGGNVYSANRADRLEHELNGANAVIRQQVGELRDGVTAAARAHDRTEEELRAQLLDTRGRSAADIRKANADAQKHANQLAKQLSEEQQKQQEAVLTKIGEVRQETVTANTKVDGLTTDVSSVKTEFAQAKTTLDDTVSQLKSVRGDLGLQSGLIATNAQELAALRTLGERTYVEFDLTRGREQKVGNILVQVKKVDAKRNKFTIEVVADDKRVEKRDRTLNEPIQFYTAQTRQPMELVVNQVKKDQVLGYLSIPKVQMARQ